MARHKKRSDAFEQERSKGYGPKEEPAMTLTTWAADRGYCTTCRSYHEGSCDESASRAGV